MDSNIKEENKESQSKKHDGLIILSPTIVLAWGVGIVLNKYVSSFLDPLRPELGGGNFHGIQGMINTVLGVPALILSLIVMELFRYQSSLRNPNIILIWVVLMLVYNLLLMPIVGGLVFASSFIGLLLGVMILALAQKFPNI